MRIRRVATVLIAMACCVTNAAQAADPRGLLERFLARADAAQVRDLTLDNDLTVFAADGRAPFASGTQRVVFRIPDRQRIEQVIEGKREVRLTVGGLTWRRGADGRVSALPEERSQNIALAMPMGRDVDSVLAEWRSFGVRDDRVHEVLVSGRRVTVIGALFGERDRPAIWFDPDYGVTRVVGREQSDAGAVMTDVAFTDHRPLADGLFVPHRQENFRSGKRLVRLIVRSVALNTNPPDALFDPAALQANR